MIDMFTSYQKLSDNYIPNNLTKEHDHLKCKSYTKLDPQKAGKPYELYNAKGELEGYTWYEGMVLNLEFNIEGELTLDGKDDYEDIYITVDDYIKDKSFIFNLFNFRYEVIYEKVLPGSTKLIIPIDQKLSEMLKKGIYYCTLKCTGEESVEILFDKADCKFLVK